MSHELSAINLGQIGEAIMAGTKPVSILWQEEDTIAFVARNRPYRSSFTSTQATRSCTCSKGTRSCTT